MLISNVSTRLAKYLYDKCRATAGQDTCYTLSLGQNDQKVTWRRVEILSWMLHWSTDATTRSAHDSVRWKKTRIKHSSSVAHKLRWKSTCHGFRNTRFFSGTVLTIWSTLDRAILDFWCPCCSPQIHFARSRQLSKLIHTDDKCFNSRRTAIRKIWETLKWTIVYELRFKWTVTSVE